MADHPVHPLLEAPADDHAAGESFHPDFPPLPLSALGPTPAARSAERKQFSSAFVLSLVVHGFLILAIILAFRFARSLPARPKQYGVLSFTDGDGQGGDIATPDDIPMPRVTSPSNKSRENTTTLELPDMPASVVSPQPASLPPVPLIPLGDASDLAAFPQDTTRQPHIKSPDRPTDPNTNSTPGDPAPSPSNSSAPAGPAAAQPQSTSSNPGMPRPPHAKPSAAAISVPKARPETSFPSSTPPKRSAAATKARSSSTFTLPPPARWMRPLSPNPPAIPSSTRPPSPPSANGNTRRKWSMVNRRILPAPSQSSSPFINRPVPLVALNRLTQ